MMSKEQKQALLDRGIQKLTSRKLLVWLTATGLMAWGGLESADWVIISGLYLGGQSVIDAIVKLKGLEQNEADNGKLERFKNYN